MTTKLKRLIPLVLPLFFCGLFSACASNADNQQEVDQKLKALFDQNDKFQKMAISKISALEKEVKTLKSNQAKLAKQIPAIVKQIKILKAAVAKAGEGVPPEMEEQINGILASLETLENDLAQVKESGVPAAQSPAETTGEEDLDPIQVLPGSDQELVLREYGRPTERYTIDNKNQVWLYDNGVVVFDLKGSLVSLKFE